MDSEEINRRLLYRDALMLVLDKPAGLPVHKGTGGGETLDEHFEHLRFGLPRPPSLAHRLDRDTSGCLILGRNRHALHKLGNMFAIGRIKKTYWALVSGTPAQPEGSINLPLIKQSQSQKRWWMKIYDGAPLSQESEKAAGVLSALTLYKVLATTHDVSWLELKPHTGRTHQLRVHCAALGHPILGDKIYGDAGSAPMLQLHARALEVPLYDKKPPIEVQAPAPAHMLEALQALGYVPGS